MIIEKPKVLHTTPNAASGKMAPDLQRAYENAMSGLARQFGQQWDGGKPTVPPLPANPYSGKQ